MRLDVTYIITATPPQFQSSMMSYQKAPVAQIPSPRGFTQLKRPLILTDIRIPGSMRMFVNISWRLCSNHAFVVIRESFLLYGFCGRAADTRVKLVKAH